MHKHAIFGEILPFYSKTTNPHFGKEEETHLKPYWHRMVTFIKRSDFDAVILMIKQHIRNKNSELYQIINANPDETIEIKINSKRKIECQIIKIGDISGLITPFLRYVSKKGFQRLAKTIHNLA
ncbi:MAG: hypothetical protein ACFFC7_22580 [Candidatus Hermodarchaeota archaeon]